MKNREKERTEAGKVKGREKKNVVDAPPGEGAYLHLRSKCGVSHILSKS